MVYDTDYREAPLAAIDTAYPLTQQGADTPGPFIVPTTASKITGIYIGLGSLVQDVYVGTTSAVHLFGSGITIGEGYFPGPMMNAASAAATCGGYAQASPMKYKTNIPVKGGGTFSAEAFIHGEDPVSAHVILMIEYDGVPGRIRDCDYREETIGAAANTLTRLGVRGAGVAEPDFNPVGTIGEVIFGAIMDPNGDAAASFTSAPALHLSGAGLLVNGNYKFIGACGFEQPDNDIAGNQAQILSPERYICNIQVKVGSQIRASAQNLESILSSHAICGLAYV